MGVEERLQELVKEGDAEQAKRFARGVISSQKIQRIDVTDGGVRVETPGFVGIHSLHPSATTIIERYHDIDDVGVQTDAVTVTAAEYHLNSETVHLEFDLQSLHRGEVIKYVTDTYCIHPDNVPEPSITTDERGDEQDGDRVNSNDEEITEHIDRTDVNPDTGRGLPSWIPIDW